MQSSTTRNSAYYYQIGIIGLMFFIFGFVTWLNGTLIPFLKLACELDTLQALAVTFAFYISYFFLAIPSSKILQKTGFKNGMALGLLVMAIGCLVIEALESFYQGKKDSKGESAKMFEELFKRPTGLRVFGNGDWFYKQIRCGILHQAETTAGWRILRKGKLLDEDERTINATLFIRHLQAAVVDYAEQLEMDNKLWRKFRRKMNAVCENCVATAPAAPVQGNP